MGVCALPLLSFTLLLSISLNCFSQVPKTQTFTSAEFTFKDGQKKIYQINKEALLSANLFEMHDGSSPDTVGIHSVKLDSKDYIIVRPGKSGPFVLEKRISGKINLFVSPRENNDEYTYVEKDDQLYQLRRYRKYLLQSHYLMVDEYQSVLQYLMRDNSEISPAEFQRLPFDTKKIGALVAKYNGVLESEATERSPEVKGKKYELHLAALAGLAGRRFDVWHPYATPGMKTVRSATVMRPMVGLSAIVFNSFYSRFNFVTDLTVEKTMMSSVTSHTRAPGFTVKSSVNYDFTEMGLSGSARFSVFRSGNTRLYLGMGGSIRWQVQNDSYCTSQQTIGTVELTEEKWIIPDATRHSGSRWVNATVVKKNFEARYVVTPLTTYLNKMLPSHPLYDDLEDRSTEHRLCLLYKFR